MWKPRLWDAIHFFDIDDNPDGDAIDADDDAGAPDNDDDDDFDGADAFDANDGADGADDNDIDDDDDVDVVDDVDDDNAVWTFILVKIPLFDESISLHLQYTRWKDR